MSYKAILIPVIHHGRHGPCRGINEGELSTILSPAGNSFPYHKSYSTLIGRLVKRISILFSDTGQLFQMGESAPSIARAMIMLPFSDVCHGGDNHSYDHGEPQAC